MKMKKLLALLLACIMLCGVFAVVPVTAEDAADVTVDDGFAFKAYQPEMHPGWAKSATVEGYDAYYTLDASYAISTKNTYDMNDTTIRLSDVKVNNGGWVIINIAPVAYNQGGLRDDVDNGKFSIQLNFNYSDASFRVYNDGGNEYTDFDKVIPKADNYEFKFNKSEVEDALGFSTVEYELRINNYSILTTNEEHWLARLMESESFSNSIITIGTSTVAKFNANVEEYRGFSTTNPNGATVEFKDSAVVSGTTDDGYTTMSLDGKIAATTKGYDFTDKTLSVRPKWGRNSDNTLNFGSAMSITFTSQRLTDKKTSSDENTLCLLFGPNGSNEDRYKIVYVSSDRDYYSSVINPWQATLGETSDKSGKSYKDAYTRVQTDGYDTDTKVYSGNEEYNFSFVDVGNDKWTLVINGTYYQSDIINAFCNNGGLDDAYVTVAGAGGIKASCKVVDRKISDWANNSGCWSSGYNGSWWTKYAKTEEGLDKVYSYLKSVHMSAEKVNLFETTVDVDIYADLTVTNCIQIGFESEYGLETKNSTAQENVLMFSFNTWPTGKITDGKFVLSAGTDYEVKLDSANVPGWSSSSVKVKKYGTNTFNIKFNFVKEADGSYSVYINQKKLSSNDYPKLAAFCENYGNGSFISIKNTDNNRVVCAPALNETVNSHKLAVADVEIKDNVLKNVNPYVTVADLKANATVEEYYSYIVTDAFGETLADDAVIGSGCKISIAYNLLKDGSSTVDCSDAAQEIIVLGDTDGDAKVTAKDTVNVKRAVLGMAAKDGVYTDALNACYDNAINVLDYIATAKSIVD